MASALNNLKRVDMPLNKETNQTLITERKCVKKVPFLRRVLIFAFPHELDNLFIIIDHNRLMIGDNAAHLGTQISLLIITRAMLPFYFHKIYKIIKSLKTYKSIIYKIIIIYKIYKILDNENA